MFLEPYTKRSCRVTDVVLIAILALDLVHHSTLLFYGRWVSRVYQLLANGIKRLVMCTDPLFFEGSCESPRHALHIRKRDAEIGASFLCYILEFFGGSKGGLQQPGLVVVIQGH